MRHRQDSLILVALKSLTSRLPNCALLEVVCKMNQKSFNCRARSTATVEGWTLLALASDYLKVILKQNFFPSAPLFLLEYVFN